MRIQTTIKRFSSIPIREGSRVLSNKAISTFSGRNDVASLTTRFSKASFSSTTFNKQKIISESSFSPEIVKILREPINTADIEIKPDGILYLPEIKYRRILNRSFGPGGWAMVPQGDFIIKDGFVCQQFALYADGRFVASSWGEQSYDEQKMRFKSLATALEGAKSNGLMRCCKDLGIASELWDPQYIMEWKKHYVVEVWVTNRITGKKKKLYRRKDRPPFDYPWVEDKVVEGGGASPEWVAIFDVENTADLNNENAILDEEEVFAESTTPSQEQPKKKSWEQRRFEQNLTSEQPRSQFQGQQHQQNLQGKQKSKPSFDDFEDDDDDLFATPTKSTPQQSTQQYAQASSGTQKKVEPAKGKKAQVFDEEDYLDSDGEPDMFADFNDEPEDTQGDMYASNAPSGNAKVNEAKSSSFENDYTSQGFGMQDDFAESDMFAETPAATKNVELDLNEVVYFGKYKGKTWNDILRDRSFLNYAKWAEAKMRPGEVRDKIITAYKLAKELQNES